MASGVFFLFAGSICLLANTLDCIEVDISLQELFAARCFSAPSTTLVHWEICAVNVDSVLSANSLTMFYIFGFT